MHQAGAWCSGRRRGKPCEMWSQVHVSKSRPRMRRHARSGTRDVPSELASPASQAWSTKRHGPSDQPPDECAHDARSALASDAEAPSGSGSGGGEAVHSRRSSTNTRSLSTPRPDWHTFGTLSSKLAHFPQRFRGSPKAGLLRRCPREGRGCHSSGGGSSCGLQA